MCSEDEPVSSFETFVLNYQNAQSHILEYHNFNVYGEMNALQE
jgi:hypothetical protein